MNKVNPKKKNDVKKLRLEAARLAEIMNRAEYVKPRQLYLQNFIRGVFFGFGSLLGATLLVAVLVWLLSIFDSLPLVGPMMENARQIIRGR